MNEHDVDGCRGVVVNAGYFETLYLVEGGFGALEERMSAQCLACGDSTTGGDLVLESTSTTDRCTPRRKWSCERKEEPTILVHVYLDTMRNSIYVWLANYPGSASFICAVLECQTTDVSREARDFGRPMRAARG